MELDTSNNENESARIVPALVFSTVRELVQHELGSIRPGSVIDVILRRHEGKYDLADPEEHQSTAQIEQSGNQSNSQVTEHTCLCVPESGSLEKLQRRRRRTGRRLMASFNASAFERALQGQNIIGEKLANTPVETLAHWKVTEIPFKIQGESRAMEDPRTSVLVPKNQTLRDGKGMKGAGKRSGYPGLERHSNARLQQEFNHRTLRLYKMAGVRGANMPKYRKAKAQPSMRESAMRRAEQDRQTRTEELEDERLKEVCEEYVANMFIKQKTEGGYMTNDPGCNADRHDSVDCEVSDNDGEEYWDD